MDWIAALRRLRAAAVQARTGPEDAPPGRITAQADGEAMDVRVIGLISWWAGLDVVPVAERIMEERPARVRLYVDSPGGDLFDAMALRAALDASGATVTATAGAMVASAALPVYLTGTVRSAQSYTRTMIHQPRVTFIAHGTATDVTESLEAFLPTFDAALGLYRDAIATHVEAATVDGWLARNADVWLDAAEAAEAGILTAAPGAGDEPDGPEATAHLRHLVRGLAAQYGTPQRRH